MLCLEAKVWFGFSKGKVVKEAFVGLGQTHAQAMGKIERQINAYKRKHKCEELTRQVITYPLKGGKRA